MHYQQHARHPLEKCRQKLSKLRLCIICNEETFFVQWVILVVVYNFCETKNVWCFILRPLPSADYMQLWDTGYFRTIFPRLKHRGSFLLWCGDGMTGHANRGFEFFCQHVLQLGECACLASICLCLTLKILNALRLAAENLWLKITLLFDSSSSKWNKMNGYSM